MKTRTFVLSLLVLGLVGLACVPAFTEEGDEAPAGKDPMEAWGEEVSRVGENHKWLEFMVGTWSTDNKFWMGPGEPQTSTGKVTNQWILGGRHMRANYSGEWAGSTFQGEGTISFNTASEEYQSYWIDSMGTFAMFDTGTREGDVLTFKGKTESPFGKLATRTVVSKKSDDEYVYESYWMMPKEMGGVEFKVMEITYTRAQ